MDYVLQIFYMLVYFFCPLGLSYEGGMLDSAITKVFIYFPPHPVVFLCKWLLEYSYQLFIIDITSLWKLAFNIIKYLYLSHLMIFSINYTFSDTGIMTSAFLVFPLTWLSLHPFLPVFFSHFNHWILDVQFFF